MKLRSIMLGAALTASTLAGPARADGCKVNRIAELSVTMQGLRPIVTTLINGRPAPFILDSGAFHSTISAATARELGLRETAMPGFQLRGVNGSTTAGVTTVKDFTLAGTTIHNVEFVVGGTDVGATGLFGQNILGLGDVEYDLPDGAVRLFKSQGCNKTGMAYWTGGKPFFSIAIESLEAARRHTSGIVELDGAKLRADFDTGAARTVMSLKAAARAGVKPGDPGVERAGWDTGLGGRVARGWIGHFKLLKIGDEELRNVRLRISDIDFDGDMLLGADFFVSHRLYVSNAQRRIYFTYTGGRVFDTGARADPAGPVVAQGGTPASDPTDAEGWSRHGAMRETQRDLPGAIADFARAVALAPADPRYTLQRAFAYAAARRPVLAMHDLDTTLQLAPGDAPARLLRAQLRARSGDNPGAVTDLDQLAAALPRENANRLELGQLYSTTDAFEKAVAQFDLWLAAHPEDAHRATALNGRCWARALWGHDLGKARGDCDAAVRAVAGNAGYLDSRGLVWLRLGDDDRAIADFDAALAMQPRLAWSLYGRALAERHKGLAERSDRDMAAAVAVVGDIAERAARYGVK